MSNAKQFSTVMIAAYLGLIVLVFGYVQYAERHSKFAVGDCVDIIRNVSSEFTAVEHDYRKIEKVGSKVYLIHRKSKYPDGRMDYSVEISKYTINQYKKAPTSACEVSQ